MASEIQRLLITATVGDERTSSGNADIRLFNSQERLRESLKKLGMFWGLSLLSVLIPVFHFFTVPLLFLVGVFMARRSYLSPGRVYTGEITCPHCHNKVQINPMPLQWPLTEICQSCARVLRINASGSA